MSRSSGESRKSSFIPPRVSSWTPASAGVTNDRCLPVTKDGLDQGQSGDRCRVGADHTGPERNGMNEILRSQQSLLFAGEAALGTDEHRHGAGLQALQNGERALGPAHRFLAPDKLARPFPAAEQTFEGLRIENLRQANQIALLGRLYDIASQAVDVDAFSNGAPGDDRLEPPDPISVAF